MCSLLNNFFNPAQEGELVYKRECRFGLIKNVDATALQAVLNQCNKTLAMGALVYTLAAIVSNIAWVDMGEAINLRNHVVITFGTEEESVLKREASHTFAQVFP